jgi:hypothetical protein
VPRETFLLFFGPPQVVCCHPQDWLGHSDRHVTIRPKLKQCEI